MSTRSWLYCLGYKVPRAFTSSAGTSCVPSEHKGEQDHPPHSRELQVSRVQDVFTMAQAVMLL